MQNNVCFHTLSDLGYTDQNVNQEIRGCTIICTQLYIHITEVFWNSISFTLAKEA